MKSKNIPADIKAKSIKEAQNEIKDIIENLEDEKADLDQSVDKYNRMLHLNYHIQEKFKKKLLDIKKANLNKKNLIDKD
tara:strand:- start:103 stop:339 length:237 start_codon:yes stop_codon:yes gene_type:complete